MAVMYGSTDSAGQSAPAEASTGVTTVAPTLRVRIQKAAALREIPLAAIITAVTVVGPLTPSSAASSFTGCGRHPPDGGDLPRELQQVLFDTDSITL